MGQLRTYHLTLKEESKLQGACPTLRKQFVLAKAPPNHNRKPELVSLKIDRVENECNKVYLKSKNKEQLLSEPSASEELLLTRQSSN